MANKKAGKWIGIAIGVVLLLYIGQVVLFEVRLGVNQPENQSTIVIATFDEESNRHERVVRLVEYEGEAYIAVNHWPRAWYHQALDNPQIEVQMAVSYTHLTLPTILRV